MCSRMSCALNKASLLHACQYQDPTGRYSNPKWVELNNHGGYTPSYNIAPRSYHPVLMSSVHLPRGVRSKSGKCYLEGGQRHIMCPMRWGLVPSWFAGEPQTFNFDTFNGRLESCLDRRSFKGAIAAERRCVVVAEGFFEWKEGKSDRQPYYVYFKQPRNISMEAREWDGVRNAHELMHNGKWIGPRLLTMAGIFDVSTYREVLYSFSILTMPAPRYLQWLSDRVPLILDGEEAVASWLDPNYAFDELTHSVRCPPNLVSHPVSPSVAKMSNNTVECVLPYYGDAHRDGGCHKAIEVHEVRPKRRTAKSPLRVTVRAPGDRSSREGSSTRFSTGSSSSRSHDHSRPRDRGEHRHTHSKQRQRHRSAHCSRRHAPRPSSRSSRGR
ncbi:abasic site processing protein HMCES-like [Haemaphysalis longicornis]